MRQAGLKHVARPWHFPQQLQWLYDIQQWFEHLAARVSVDQEIKKKKSLKVKKNNL